MRIAVFQDELDAGLAEMIRDNTSVSYLAPITKMETPPIEIVREALAAHSPELKLIDDATLISFEDILATSGWNRNQDVLLHDELWNARHTIDHKPINMGHKYIQIVGHVVNSVAVDADYVAIADDTPVDQLPDVFHIKNQSVLYRYINDKDRDSFMANLESDIDAGLYFVSMETLFRGFDYAMRDVESRAERIVVRDKSTSFLTKHLKVYGGTGVYEFNGRRYELGRVLRRMHFKGKGIVERPGNAHSIIFSKTQPFSNSLAELGYFTSSRGVEQSVAAESPHLEETVMPEINTELENALIRIVELEKALKDATDAKLNEQIVELKSTVSSAENTITGLNVQVATLTEAVEAAVEKLKVKDAEYSTVNADLETAVAELNAFKADKLKAVRIAAVTEAGAGEAAASIVETLSVLDDATFESTVATLAKTWVKTSAPSISVSVSESVAAEKDAIDAAVIETETSEAALVVSPAPVDPSKLFAGFIDFKNRKAKNAFLPQNAN